MTKSALINYLLSGYIKTMKSENYKLIKKEIIEFKDKSEDKDTVQFAKDIKENFAHFDILHEFYVREKLAGIESNLKTIKVIIVICFILAIIGAIFFSGI